MAEKMNQKKRRIVLGATCFADASSAIDIAIGLAKPTGAKIDAMLIAETAITHFSSFPFARTISKTGQSIQKVTPEAMQKAFRQDAISFRTTLAKATQKAALDWSFKEVEGEIDTFLDSAPDETELVLLGFQNIQKRKTSKILAVESVEEKLPGSDKVGNRIASHLNFDLEEILWTGQRSPSQVNQILQLLANKNTAAVVIPESLVRAVGLNALLNAACCPLIISRDEKPADQS